jgi:hypothetical protein
MFNFKDNIKRYFRFAKLPNFELKSYTLQISVLAYQTQIINLQPEYIRPKQQLFC